MKRGYIAIVCVLCYVLLFNMVSLAQINIEFFPNGQEGYKQHNTMSVYVDRDANLYDSYLYYTFSSDVEIVAYYYEANGVKRINYMCLEDFYTECHEVDYDSDGVFMEEKTHSGNAGIKNDYFYVDSVNQGQVYTRGINEILTSNMRLFDTEQNAYNYLKFGLENGLLQDGTKTYNADELYVNSLDIQVFDSNSFDTTYIEYYYECDDSLIGSTIDFDYTYTYNTSTITNSDGYGKTSSSSKSYQIDKTKGTIRVYIDSLDCINDVLSSVWFNDEPISKRNVMGYGGNFYVDSLLYKVETSRLDIVANIKNGSTYGEQYVFTVDLITGKADKYSNTPNENGEYNYNDDYTENGGNYLTIVGRDNWGNTTYNYYYVDYDDNSKTEIDEPPKEDDDDDGQDDDDGNNSSSSTTVEGSTITNTNNNNPTFNNDITVNVEGDEINNDVDNVIDGVVDDEDNKGFLDKFMSMFGLLENNSFLKAFGFMFGWLPSEFQGIITTAITICVGIGVYKLFRR